MHGGLWIAAFAGVVQGVVEWLPVSSKTMITLIFFLGGYKPGTAYVMGLLANFGSFFAALWYFRRDVGAAFMGLRHPFSKDRDAATLRYLFLATGATGLIGLPIYIAVRHAFSLATGGEAMVAIGLLLLVTSLISWRRERLAASAAAAQPEPDRVPGTATSLIVGAAQGLAALPGISRSAVTVTPLLLRGHNGEQALRYSFLLDVVGLLGAGVVPLVIGKGGLGAIHQVGLPTVVVLLVVSAVFSFLTIGFILRFAARLRSSVVTLAVGVLTIVGAFALYVH